jgi:hypothetical protein
VKTQNHCQMLTVPVKGRNRSRGLNQARLTLKPAWDWP